MGKIDVNKQQKLDKLLESAFNQFLSKGIVATSISDITTHAGVAKGTFYLYFKDKYSIRDYLVAKSAKSLFHSAHEALMKENDITDFSDKIIFITNHIIHELEKNKPLLRFISKSLSWGLFHDLITDQIIEEDMSGQEIFEKLARECNVSLRDPQNMIFIIVEMVNATTYSVILGKGPATLEEILPDINDAIRAIIQSHIL